MDEKLVKQYNWLCRVKLRKKSKLNLKCFRGHQCQGIERKVTGHREV